MTVLYFKSILIQEGQNRYYRAAYVIQDGLRLFTVELTQDNEGYLYEVMNGFYLRSEKRIPIEDIAESFYDGKPLSVDWYHC